MNDNIKELLELAAKACGYTLVWGEQFKVGGDLIDCTDMPYIKSTSPDESDVYWHPGQDDGDGARMEAQLKLNVRWAANFVEVQDSVSGHLHACDIYKTPGDKNSGRRMASLRVAAEIARRMKCE